MISSGPDRKVKKEKVNTDDDDFLCYRLISGSTRIYSLLYARKSMRIISPRLRFKSLSYFLSLKEKYRKNLQVLINLSYIFVNAIILIRLYYFG